MAQAVKTILKADFNDKLDPVNPWSIAYHIEGCDSLTIWQDDGRSLIDINDLRDKTTNRIKCGACRHGHELWTSLLKLADEDTDRPTLYGDLAYRGLGLVNKVLTWGFPVSEMDGFDFELMTAVHSARTQFETWLTIERQKKAEANVG